MLNAQELGKAKPFEINGIIFRDPSKPQLGILLSPDVDAHFDSFELSACTMVKMKKSNLNFVGSYEGSAGRMLSK
jgi:hypothetical protein